MYRYNTIQYKTIKCNTISFRLELIPPRGGVSHSDPSSPLLSISSRPMLFLFNRRDFMSCCMMSPHRFLCRPQLRRPLTYAVIILFMEFSSSLLITWPYHHSLASLILSVMHATPACF